ncbi:MAG: cobalt-factor II C(20)-methyltransferase [Bacillota bacterium]
MAKLYGIGTGPGDSSLLTLKAVKILESIDVIFTPEAKKGGDSLALSIVKDYINPKAEIIQKHFPMNFNEEEKNEAWDEIAEDIEAQVKGGKNVAFITLGDSMTYSTYIYLLIRLQGKIDIETVPGITSFANIAASHNMPLVFDKDSLVVVPCTTDHEKIDFALANFNSIVLMKVYKNFQDIIDKIKEHKLEKHAILVSNSSLEEEKVYRNLENVDKGQISYFSTIVINKNITA